MLNKKQSLLILVRSTLHHEWDPIGMVELNGPEDEYHAYADQVFSQLVHGWEPKRIADYLHQIATEYIGMKKTAYQLSLDVANKLSAASKDYLDN